MSYAIDLIIPLYNNAAFCDQIVNALESQSFREFRAIFVDDGSKDHTVEILSQRLQSASFPYLLISKENGGAASARNTGLRQSDAPWIGFVDGDDIPRPEYLEYLYTAATKAEADLAICRYQEYYPEKNQAPEAVNPLSFRKTTAEEAMDRYCTQWLGVYCLLMKREIFLKDHLYFDENCHYCEDAPYIAEVINAADQVAIIENALYLYVIRQGSLSHNGAISKFMSGIGSFQRTVANMEKQDKATARLFATKGCARYYLATLKKAAVQLPYSEFTRLEKDVPLKEYKKYLGTLSRSQALAARVYLLSSPLFYQIIRKAFRN